MAKKFLSVLLAALLTPQPVQFLFGSNQQHSAKEAVRAARVEEKVEGLGVGAVVKVKLKDTQEQRGRIEDIANESFHLAMKDQTVNLRFADVEDLNLVNPKYKATGQIDPVRVRQVVFSLGVGQKTKLKLTSEVKIIGDIQSINKDSFAIFEPSTTRRIPVLFKEVSEIAKAKDLAGTRQKIVWLSILAGLTSMFVLGAAISKD